MSQTWSQCLNTLKDSIPISQYNIWIQPLKALENKNTLSLLAPNSQVLNYINKNLKPQIKNAVTKHNKNLKIYIGIACNPDIKQQTTPLFEDYTFNNLVLGNSNQMAYSATKQIAENIKTSPYNPFIIYGKSGLGKTHLMQAAGHLAKEKNPNIKIIYVPLIDFVRNITSSLRHNSIEKIKNFYQSTDLLLVDDINLIAGKEKSQEEFFHIFNSLFSGKKQIIFTCDQPPKNIKLLEDRLKTRFSQGLNLHLTPPGLEMRAAILLKKSQNKKININLTEDTALFIAKHIVSNIRDLEGALLKLKAFVDFSKINKSFISKEIIETALGELIKPQIKNIDINDIQKEIIKHYNLTISDLNSKSRKQHTVLARQMAMFICYKLTSLSLTKIGKHFGNRDHSTVLYAIKKIKEKHLENIKIKNDYELINIKLTNL
ncbi:MAG: chromosomal replication initiator protein DnaA [Candidatus Vesicomyosocius endoextente]|uniref:Chromosomal replication initiator protein DnaA n=1 Tax=Candidatus Vesicomyosocius endoextente TaxID=2738853 RepID=A0A853G982_9GAMM|nr:chromosomal replication initiator protein DnaA [Candidatus Vesicomyosocius endoextente]